MRSGRGAPALETGVPVEIERRGPVLRIQAVEQKTKLERLIARPVVNGDPADLVHLDWSGECLHDRP